MRKRNHAAIGNYIRKCREKSGLSQGDVADALGYSTAQFISNWERGLASPPLTTLPRLQKLIGIKVNTFINLYVAETRRMIRQEMRRHVEETYGRN